MIEPKTVYVFRCDECGATFDWQEFEETAYFDTEAEALACVIGALDDSEAEWSTNGEGRYICGLHERLTLTPAAKDEIARRPGPNDIPLDFGAIT